MRLIDCHAKRDDDYDWGDNSRDPTCERRGVVSHDRGGVVVQKNTAPVDDAPPLTPVKPPCPEPDLMFPELPWLLMCARASLMEDWMD